RRWFPLGPAIRRVVPRAWLPLSRPTRHAVPVGHCSWMRDAWSRLPGRAATAPKSRSVAVVMRHVFSNRAVTLVGKARTRGLARHSSSVGAGAVVPMIWLLYA